MLNNKKVSDIAKELGLHLPNISAVIAGKSKTAHIRAAISRAIKKPVEEIWPEEVKEK